MKNLEERISNNEIIREIQKLKEQKADLERKHRNVASRIAKLIQQHVELKAHLDFHLKRITEAIEILETFNAENKEYKKYDN